MNMTEFWTIFRVSVTALYMLALIFLMSRFQCNAKTARIVYIAVGAYSVLFNGILCVLFGRTVMMRYYALGIAIPCLFVMVLYTKDKFSQLFFNFFTAVNAMYLTSVIGLSATHGEIIWLDTLIRAVLFSGILYLFRHYFAGPYHFLAENMIKGWIVISMIPFLFYAMVMFLGLYPTLRHDNFPVVVMLYIVLALIYVVIYRTFQTTYVSIHQEQYSKQMESYLALQAHNHEQLREIRHDMRHVLNNFIALLQDGKTDEALRYAEQYRLKVDRSGAKTWCANRTLNAILGYYLDQAVAEGIEVEARLDFPETLPVDVMELSICLSNAVENALNACRRQPDGAKRLLLMTSVIKPQFTIEIANTCSEPVRLGRDGLPVPSRPGHGVGTQSIAAFARRHHADLHYIVEDNMVRLYLIFL